MVMTCPCVQMLPAVGMSDAYKATGRCFSVAAGRVSFVHGFKGVCFIAPPRGGGIRSYEADGIIIYVITIFSAITLGICTFAPRVRKVEEADLLPVALASRGQWCPRLFQRGSAA